MEPTPPGISFVVPFCNEAEGAERTIDVLLAAGRTLQHDGIIGEFEVLAIDDGSTDGTGELLRRSADGHDEVAILGHPSNRGLGAALRSGFRAATKDWIFYTDADLPVDPLIVARTLRVAELHDIDIVSCYRLDRTGEGTGRAVLSSGYNLATRLVTGLVVRDVNFAAKLVRRSVAMEHLPTCDSGFFDAELLARAIANGARVRQIGVDYFPRTAGTSTALSVRSILDTARDLARIGPTIRLRGR